MPGPPRIVDCAGSQPPRTRSSEYRIPSAARQNRQTLRRAVHVYYMQTPDVPFQVRPAPSHALFDVWRKSGRSDDGTAHPANPKTTRTMMATAFMGFPPWGAGAANPAPVS